MFFKYFYERNNVVKSLKVALIVGIILNIINQGELIWNLEFSTINYLKIILTFIVPYLVSSYSHAMSKIE